FDEADFDEGHGHHRGEGDVGGHGVTTWADSMEARSLASSAVRVRRSSPVSCQASASRWRQWDGRNSARNRSPASVLATRKERRSPGLIWRSTYDLETSPSTTLVRLAGRTEMAWASSPMLSGRSARCRTVRMLSWLTVSPC